MQFCTINLFGSLTTEAAVFHKIMEQACKAANELDAAVVTGHTGTYDSLSTVVGVCTGYGHVDKNMLVTPGGAKPGDHVVCINPIGLETAVNLALTHGALAEKLFGVERTKELTKLVTLQSCVKEALLLAETKEVHAMHDATEGGLTAALNEMPEASNVGFEFEWEHLLIPNEVQAFRQFYELSPVQVLSLSSTGTFLVAVSPEDKAKIESVLSQNRIEARFIGSFTKDKKRILIKNWKKQYFPRESDDPYTKLLAKKP